MRWHLFSRYSSLAYPFSLIVYLRRFSLLLKSNSISFHDILLLVQLTPKALKNASLHEKHKGKVSPGMISRLPAISEGVYTRSAKPVILAREGILDLNLIISSISIPHPTTSFILLKFRKKFMQALRSYFHGQSSTSEYQSIVQLFQQGV